MTPQDNDIFDDSFEDFEDDGLINQSNKTGPGGTSSLLDLWNNNPMVKLAVIAGLVVIAIGSVYAFVGGGDKGPQTPSRIGQAPEDREAPGGLVSETYGDALEEQNQQKLEAALGNREVSAIPVPVNRGDPSLNPGGDQGVVTEDPLAVWQRENAAPVQEAPPVAEAVPPPPPPAPQANPEQVMALSDAINSQIQNILANRAVKPGQYVAFQMDGLQTAQAQQQQAAIEAAQTAAEEQGGVEEILVPAGTILYAQILNMADSDAEGPIVAQILSGPLVGARAIGRFEEAQSEDKLIITFETAVVDGVGNNMNGVAIDPATTSPGLRTDIDRRYFRRVVLPAAAQFLEGLGNAYAQQETQVFTTGDVIVTEQNKLNTKEQFAAGVAEGAQKAGDILEDEGDKLEPRVIVAAGTPIGIVLVDPIVRPDTDQQYNPETSASFP